MWAPSIAQKFLCWEKVLHAIITFLLSLKNKVLKILGIFFPALCFNGWLEQFGCQTSLIQNLLPQKKIQKHKDFKDIFFLKTFSNSWNILFVKVREDYHVLGVKEITLLEECKEL